MFQAKKQPLYLFDRGQLHSRLDTLWTMYGIEGVAEIINDWLLGNDQLKDYWRMEKIANLKDLEAYDK